MRVSVVIVAYNMGRELPRTLRSLSPGMQTHVQDLEYEVIVVDNGSDVPLSIDTSPDWLRLIRIENGSQSPVEAVNRGLTAATGDLVGVMIDGARLVSPGVVGGAARAACLHKRPVIAVVGCHLGSDVQMKTVHRGYDQHAEDRMLSSTGWESDGYRLFDTSVFAGSSSAGWFGPIAESNALFMSAPMWDELGGYDKRFASPGGGLVNLDTFERATSLPNSRLIVLLGEATFHQVHGGVATNAPVSRWDEFHSEYKEIRGRAFSAPQLEPLYVGSIHSRALRPVHDSAATSLSLGCSNET